MPSAAADFAHHHCSLFRGHEIFSVSNTFSRRNHCLSPTLARRQVDRATASRSAPSFRIPPRLLRQRLRLHQRSLHHRVLSPQRPSRSLFHLAKITNWPCNAEPVAKYKDRSQSIRQNLKTKSSLTTKIRTPLSAGCGFSFDPRSLNVNYAAAETLAARFRFLSNPPSPINPVPNSINDPGSGVADPVSKLSVNSLKAPPGPV